jgi:hypothetical protein
MTEDEERKRSTVNLTLLEEVRAAEAWSAKLVTLFPEMPFPVTSHFTGIAELLGDVAVKLEGLKSGKSYEEA